MVSLEKKIIMEKIFLLTVKDGQNNQNMRLVDL